MNAENLELSCARTRELASAWIDGELRDERELALHLALCGVCRAFVDDLRAIRGDFAALESEPAPDLWPRIAASAPRAARRRYDVALRVAAALIGATGAWVALSSTESSPGEPRDGLARALTRIAAPETAPNELQRVLDAPEHQLLLAIASQTEERR